MSRLPLIGALAAGLLMTGALAPAVASASTTAAGTTASTPAAGTTAPSTANPVPAGSSLGPDFPAQALLLMPQLLGNVDRHR
jgi:hypothetical protein